MANGTTETRRKIIDSNRRRRRCAQVRRCNYALRTTYTHTRTRRVKKRPEAENAFDSRSAPLPRNRLKGFYAMLCREHVIIIIEWSTVATRIALAQTNKHRQRTAARLPLLLLTRDPDDQPDQGEAGRRRMIIIRPSAHAPRRRCAAVSEKLSPGARARRAAPRKHACDANVLFHDRAQQLQTINYVFLAGRRCDDTAATAIRPGAGYQIAACASARAMCVPGVCE